MVRSVPSPDGVTRRHLPVGAALAGLSVKVRGGGALQIMAYRDCPGDAGSGGPRPRAHGVWQKGSFPVGPLSPGSGDRPAGRRQPKGGISQFSRASRQIVAPAAGLGQPQCEVEPTEVCPVVKTGGRWGSRRPAPRSAPQRTPGHRRARVRPGSARWCANGWPVVLPTTPRRPGRSARGDGEQLFGSGQPGADGRPGALRAELVQSPLRCRTPLWPDAPHPHRSAGWQTRGI